ncbi:hypothetical protein B0T16DRAFT_405760 [Cercophora newfieldiana]|uniref:Uncharacterized protein n=1 Tax=Cercophora newfieldiana TaxID=92897 RepID=A0AA39YIN8_9PEZI|nr:hypothetical protein B0T16DRAFT_405760 [Cercophora newfieldiana]
MAAPSIAVAIPLACKITAGVNVVLGCGSVTVLPVRSCWLMMWKDTQPCLLPLAACSAFRGRDTPRGIAQRLMKPRAPEFLP